MIFDLSSPGLCWLSICCTVGATILMVMFLLCEEKKGRISRVDCLIPEQPATLRKAMFEYTPSAHPIFPCLAPSLNCCLQEVLLSRDRKEELKKKAVKGSKTC